MVRFSIECLLPKVLRAMWFSLVGVLEFGLHCLHAKHRKQTVCSIHSAPANGGGTITSFDNCFTSNYRKPWGPIHHSETFLLITLQVCEDLGR